MPTRIKERDYDVRHKELLAVPMLLAALAACGPTAAKSTNRPVASAPTIGLTAWYTQAAVPLQKLGTLYVDMSHTPSTGKLQGTGLPDSLRSAAQDGLAIPEPAGNPNLGNQYDQVMYDAENIANDIDNDENDQFISDIDTATDHLKTFQDAMDEADDSPTS